MSEHIPTEIVDGVHRPSSAVPIDGTSPMEARPSHWQPKRNEHIVDPAELFVNDEPEPEPHLESRRSVEIHPTLTYATAVPSSGTPTPASAPGQIPLALEPTPQSSADATATASPSQTVVDLNDQPAGKGAGGKAGGLRRAEEDWIASEETNVAARAEEGKREDAAHGGGAEVKLSQGRKWFLLGIFCLSQYVDTLGYSGLFIFTDQILTDLNVKYEASSWILTAYTVTFASFLLFWGRVSDLYSARPVFAYGFFGVAVFNVVISVMPDQYSYFVLRAICGIFGACTIPSAYRLILAIFEPEELPMALTAIGLAGAIANVTGLIIAGFFGFITAQGQMSAWRWFFRGVCFMVFPFAIAAILVVPKTKPAMADQCTCAMDRFKRLDLVGCFSMLFGIIALILGLTLGASYGWKTADFLVPFLVAWPLFVFFFVWESRMPPGYAILPASFWKIPNMPLLMFMAIGVFPWWATNQLVFVERFLAVFNNPPIIAAVRMLPEGIAAFAVGAVFPPLLAKIGDSKWITVFSSVIQAVAFVLFILMPDGYIYNNNYWRWYCPGMIIGSAATMAVFLALNITIMTSVPPEASGVASAVFQVCLQLGAVVALSIQAGLLTVNPGTFENYANVKVSFWFQFGWFLLNAALFALFFRPGKAAPGSEAAQKGDAEAVEGPKKIQ